MEADTEKVIFMQDKFTAKQQYVNIHPKSKLLHTLSGFIPKTLFLKMIIIYCISTAPSQYMTQFTYATISIFFYTNQISSMCALMLY
jgi:hypothetical protein